MRQVGWGSQATRGPHAGRQASTNDYDQGAAAAMRGPDFSVPRLLDFVTHVQAKRLSVIKAPAGFGKTSLAVAWADRLSQSGTSVANLSPCSPSAKQKTAGDETRSVIGNAGPSAS